MRRWGWCVGAAALALGAYLALRAPERGGGALARGAEGSEPPVEASAAAELVASAPEAMTALDEPSAVFATVDAPAQAAVSRERVAPHAGATLVPGVLVEGATGAPVPQELGLAFSVSSEEAKGLVVALFGTRALRLDPGGRFELESRRPERMRGYVIDGTSGERLERAPHRYAEEREADGSWRVPLSATWLARLEVVPLAGVEVGVRTATLVDLVDGVEKERKTIVLSGERPLVVCRDAAPDAPRASRRWLDVSAADLARPVESELGSSSLIGRVEVPLDASYLPRPLRVELQPEFVVRGRVVDERGAPWSEAVVELVPRAAPRAVRAGELWQSTDDDGGFRFEELEPGAHRLRVSAPFARGVEQDCELFRGDNDLGELLLPRGGPRGTVRGELVAPEGAREGPKALLTLREVSSGVEVTGVAFEFDLFGGGSGERTGFELLEVPEGEYELDVLALDGWTYPDSPYRVEAPASGLRIEARGREAPPCHLRAIDARSGEELEEPYALFLRGGRWLPFLGDEIPDPRGAPIVVLARGHVPRRVDASATLVSERDGASVLEVALEPGSGHAVLFREVGAAPSASGEDYEAYLMPPLAGARVVAGGRELARSDASGLALITEGQPGALAFELPGYRVVSRDQDDGIVLVLMARE